MQREWKLGRVCFDGGSGLIEERLKKEEKTVLELSGTSSISYFKVSNLSLGKTEEQKSKMKTVGEVRREVLLKTVLGEGQRSKFNLLYKFASINPVFGKSTLSPVECPLT